MLLGGSVGSGGGRLEDLHSDADAVFDKVVET